jgi:hypothetical protein
MSEFINPSHPFTKNIPINAITMPGSTKLRGTCNSGIRPDIINHAPNDKLIHARHSYGIITMHTVIKSGFNTSPDDIRRLIKHRKHNV